MARNYIYWDTLGSDKECTIDWVAEDESRTVGYVTEGVMYADITDSTLTNTLTFAPDIKVLGVNFKDSGKHYCYFDVPSKVFEDMINANSVGEYFNKNVRNKYEFTRDLKFEALAFDIMASIKSRTLSKRAMRKVFDLAA